MADTIYKLKHTGAQIDTAIDTVNTALTGGSASGAAAQAELDATNAAVAQNTADIAGHTTQITALNTDMANIKSGNVTLAYVDAYTLGGTVTFANPMPDTNYSVVLTSTDRYGGGGSPWTNFAVDSKTVNGFHASRGNSSGAVVSTDTQHYMWIAVPYNS